MVVDCRPKEYSTGLFHFSAFGVNLVKEDISCLKVEIAKNFYSLSLAFVEHNPSSLSENAFKLSPYSPFYSIKKFKNAYFFEEKKDSSAETTHSFFDGYIFLWLFASSLSLFYDEDKYKDLSEEEQNKQKCTIFLKNFLDDLDNTVKPIYKNKHFIFFIDHNDAEQGKKDEVAGIIKQMVDAHNKECGFFSKSHKWDIVYSMEEFQELF